VSGTYRNHCPGLTETRKAQRGILEFSFADHEDGMYMFHAHQSEFTELGWVGMFDVRGPGA